MIFSVKAKYHLKSRQSSTRLLTKNPMLTTYKEKYCHSPNGTKCSLGSKGSKKAWHQLSSRVKSSTHFHFLITKALVDLRLPTSWTRPVTSSRCTSVPTALEDFSSTESLPWSSPRKSCREGLIYWPQRVSGSKQESPLARTSRLRSWRTRTMFCCSAWGLPGRQLFLPQVWVRLWSTLV